MPILNQSYDIVIIGSGIVGLTTALALAKETSLQIALIDVKESNRIWDSSRYDERVSAISLSSQRIFQQLNVWSSIQAKRISSYQAMRVWDGQGRGEIYFSANELRETTLGYIIEDSVMRVSLLEQLSAYQNLQYLAPVALESIIETNTEMTLTLKNGGSIQTALLIGADGAESWVRQQQRIDMTTKAYQHTAIIATVTTSHPHLNTAYQCFKPAGPLAFLPLDDSHTSSIVWSVLPSYAEELLALNDEDFNKTLAQALQNRLGDVLTVSTRRAFPLRMRHAKHYVGNRFALIGDAAHTVHPLAGQGVNMGLLDAAALAEVIILAHQKKRDFSSVSTLRRYERWRKSDTLAMLAAVDGLKQLFASENKAVQCIRTVGLTIANRLGFLKHAMANYALGKRDDLPRMAC